MALTVKEFVRKLRLINPKIRVCPGPNGVWGVYVRMPRHPDANPAGDVHYGGLSAPEGGCGPIPRKHYFDFRGMRCRGYLETLRILVDKGALDGKILCRYFGHDWRTA